MKFSCDLIRDLMPHYVDEVCSDESKRVVKVQRKWKKSKIILLAIGAAIAVLVIRFVIPIMAAIGIFLTDAFFTKPKVFTDVTEYPDCIGESSDSEYGTTNAEPWDVFPEYSEMQGEIVDFQYAYYNPWDAQRIAYLTVQFDDVAYEAEMERLTEYGVEEYKGYYSVSGEPEGFDLVAMNTDSYNGFVYAMIPEKEDGTIIYVGIQFCNYFLDLDIDEYMPKEFLLEGFDATQDNPYRKEKMKFR